MSHSNNRLNNRTLTNKSVYRDSPIGNLEIIMVSVVSPLQQGFYGSVRACLSNGVNGNSASLASEHEIVSAFMMHSLSAGGKNRNSKAFAVHINAENIPLDRRFKLVFGEMSGNTNPGSQSISLAYPSSICKRIARLLPLTKYICLE